MSRSENLHKLLKKRNILCVIYIIQFNTKYFNTFLIAYHWNTLFILYKSHWKWIIIIIITENFHVLYMAFASLIWKSLKSSFPPSGTRLRYISTDIRHNPLPFIGKRSHSKSLIRCLLAMIDNQLATSDLLHSLGSEK